MKGAFVFLSCAFGRPLQLFPRSIEDDVITYRLMSQNQTKHFREVVAPSDSANCWVESHLQLMIVQDSSATMGGVRGALYEEFSQLVDTWTKEFTTWEVGYASFVDKPIPGSGLWPFNGGIKFTDFCYNLATPFSDDTEKVRKAMSTSKSGGGGDTPEDVLTPTLYSLIDPRLTWKTDNPEVVKVTLVITDVAAHVKGDAQENIKLWTGPRYPLGDRYAGLGSMHSLNGAVMMRFNERKNLTAHNYAKLADLWYRKDEAECTAYEEDLNNFSKGDIKWKFGTAELNRQWRKSDRVVRSMRTLVLLRAIESKSRSHTYQPLRNGYSVVVKNSDSIDIYELTRELIERGNIDGSPAEGWTQEDEKELEDLKWLWGPAWELPLYENDLEFDDNGERCQQMEYLDFKDLWTKFEGTDVMPVFLLLPHDSYWWPSELPLYELCSTEEYLGFVPTNNLEMLQCYKAWYTDNLRNAGFTKFKVITVESATEVTQKIIDTIEIVHTEKCEAVLTTTEQFEVATSTESTDSESVITTEQFDETTSTEGTISQSVISTEDTEDDMSPTDADESTGPHDDSDNSDGSETEPDLTTTNPVVDVIEDGNGGKIAGIVIGSIGGVLALAGAGGAVVLFRNKGPQVSESVTEDDMMSPRPLHDREEVAAVEMSMFL